MIKRFQWLGFVSSLAVIFALALTGLSTGAKAAAPSHTHTATKSGAVAKADARCKTRVKAKGLITWSDWQFPDTFNPYTGGNLAITALNNNFIQDGLLLYNDKVKLQADIMTRIPSLKNGDVSNGGRTITLHLKSGIKWSNGSAITAKDVKFSWQVNSDKLTGPYCAGSCDAIARIDTPNATTDVLHMKRIYSAAIPYALEFPLFPTKWTNAWNGDPHAAAQKLQDPAFNYEDSSYPTNGPYQIQEFVKNDRIVMTPMKYYNILSCGGAIKQVIFAFYSDKNAMIAAAASKQTDMTQDYTAADLQVLNTHKGSYKIYSNPGFFFEHFEMNEDPTFQGKPNPLNNTNVRLAIALAFDKLGMIRSALSVTPAVAKGIVAWTPLVNSPGLHQPFADTKITGQWDPITKKYRSDTGSASAVSDAKKLLAKTPYSGGFTLQIATTSGNPVRAAQLGVLQENLKKLNITAVPSFIPASKFFGGWDAGGVLDHGDFQLADFAFIGQPDPDQLRANLVQKYCDRKQAVHSLVNGNYSCAPNPTIDKGFKDGAASFDPKVRQAAYSSIQLQINKNAIWIPLYSRPSISTVDNKLVNFKNNPTQFGQTWNSYAWASKG